MADGVPLLALPSGSILQFLLMTLPLLCVYSYFLYLAIDRPNIADPAHPDYTKDRIRLMDILYTYLATLVLFSSLVVYLLWFVNKRRKLSLKYEREAIVILGNVDYNESHFSSGSNSCTNFLGWLANGFTLRNNYGKLTYNLERVANHPACNYEHRKGKSLVGTITKKVRVYYRYPREQVSILVLPEYPYSGQPKTDMEADWASFSTGVGLPSEEDRQYLAQNDERVSVPQVLSRDRSLGVLLVAAFWVCFLFVSSLFVANQVSVVEDHYDDENGRTAWIVLGCVMCGGVPLIAFGGNYLRWRIYRKWILMSGKKTGGHRSKKSKKSKKSSGWDEVEEEGSAYVQMT